MKKLILDELEEIVLGLDIATSLKILQAVSEQKYDDANKILNQIPFAEYRIERKINAIKNICKTLSAIDSLSDSDQATELKELIKKEFEQLTDMFADFKPIYQEYHLLAEFLDNDFLVRNKIFTERVSNFRHFMKKKSSSELEIWRFVREAYSVAGYLLKDHDVELSTFLKFEESIAPDNNKRNMFSSFYSDCSERENLFFLRKVLSVLPYEEARQFENFFPLAYKWLMFENTINESFGLSDEQFIEIEQLFSQMKSHQDFQTFLNKCLNSEVLEFTSQIRALFCKYFQDDLTDSQNKKRVHDDKHVAIIVPTSKKLKSTGVPVQASKKNEKVNPKIKSLVVANAQDFKDRFGIALTKANKHKDSFSHENKNYLTELLVIQPDINDDPSLFAAEVLKYMSKFINFNMNKAMDNVLIIDAAGEWKEKNIYCIDEQNRTIYTTYEGQYPTGTVIIRAASAHRLVSFILEKNKNAAPAKTAEILAKSMTTTFADRSQEANIPASTPMTEREKLLQSITEKVLLLSNSNPEKNPQMKL